MNMLASGLVVLLMIVVLWMILIVFRKKSFDPGSSGTAVVTLMSFTLPLAPLLKFWSLTESCLGAVSRIKTFTETVPSEASNKMAAAALPSSLDNDAAWPSPGEIEFDKLIATYRSEPVLKSVSMCIEPEHKIAIYGRSGSGKSSLLLCLGELLPAQCGAVYIDGVDITSLTPQDILRHLSIVPQDPCFLPNTTRLNIDPDVTLSQSTLERLLQVTHLSGIVQKMGGLDAELEPSLWSARQGQLLALARAMARKSRIPILDEAMSRYACILPSTFASAGLDGETLIRIQLTAWCRVDEATQLIMEDII
ncbi:P-loop containing nucleoside triphosphate hydrolase protein [Lipomyces tetrasporus]|uniref:P-loop containing nucleoside triphosphate hydrolase protein n=1 Tax=Lipomyces tetrasporus TaxID=54092 RepID=A0AAD7QJR2_9ASCO|nr:P-loop containing nucleoside triphosphate hydrolase protein [Lipomyces tetrasporus]KAJ8096462.1 P-loop containing nucleoside triphosphate hydrolase protein [Lipomyces tetrasporus]